MSLYLLLLACNAHFTGVHSLPMLGHRNAEETVHWISAPTLVEERSVCFLVDLHADFGSVLVDVPKHKELSVSRLVRKLAWTLLALFAREVVVYTA